MNGARPDIRPAAGWPTLVAVFLVGAAATGWVMSADTAVARPFATMNPGRDDGAWSQIVQGLQNVSQLVSVATAVVLVACLDARRRRLVLAILLAQALAIVGYQLVKRSVERQRPCAVVVQGVESDGDVAATTWGAVGWADRGRARQSFPSGHSAAAFALAGVLAAGYPRAGWWFWLLAAGCALSRIVTRAHWPSDCIAGAILGWFAAQAALALLQRLPREPALR